MDPMRSPPTAANFPPLCVLLPPSTSLWGIMEEEAPLLGRIEEDGEGLKEKCWRLSGANKYAEGLLAAPPRRAVRPRCRAFRPGLPGSPARNQRTPVREGPHRDRRTLGCSKLGRPARTSSHVAEVVEEQHMGLEE
jgi:hypothetical protein